MTEGGLAVIYQTVMIPGFTGFCCTVIFSPCSKGFQKDFGSAFQSFDRRPGRTIIQAHVDLFPFINTHSQRRCDRREEEHSCGSHLL